MQVHRVGTTKIQKSHRHSRVFGLTCFSTVPVPPVPTRCRSDSAHHFEARAMRRADSSVGVSGETSTLSLPAVSPSSSSDCRLTGCLAATRSARYSFTWALVGLPPMSSWRRIVSTVRVCRSADAEGATCSPADSSSSLVLLLTTRTATASSSAAPRKSAIFPKNRRWGGFPLSHALTVCVRTPQKCASCCCVQPLLRRSRRSNSSRPRGTRSSLTTEDDDVCAVCPPISRLLTSALPSGAGLPYQYSSRYSLTRIAPSAGTIIVQPPESQEHDSACRPCDGANRRGHDGAGERTLGHRRTDARPAHIQKSMVSRAQSCRAVRSADQGA